MGLDPANAGQTVSGPGQRPPRHAKIVQSSGIERLPSGPPEIIGISQMFASRSEWCSMGSAETGSDVLEISLSARIGRAV